MTYLHLIIEIIGLFLANGVFFYSINKKLKTLELKDKEIETIRKQDDEWLELYREEKSKVSNLELKLEEERNKREAAEKRANMLELHNQQLTWYRCTVNGCPNRRPPHVYDKDGNELEAKEMDCKIIGHE